MRDEEKGTSRRAGVQSVEIGMRVLQALAELGGAASLGAIAKLTALPPPQAHRYLQSLIATGMAQQDDHSGRYDLGTSALRIGLEAMARTDAFALVDQAIKALADDMGQTILISALGPSGPTVVRFYMGRPAVITPLKVGSVLPVLMSATGRVFLSFTPAAEIEELVAREIVLVDISPETTETIRAKVRSEGFAHDTGRLIPGLRATAFPIFDLQGRATLVATAIASAAVEYPHRDAALAELQRRCATVSGELGWRAP